MSFNLFKNLYYHPNIKLLNSYNTKYNNINYKLHFKGDCTGHKVLPCPFTGDIESKSVKYISISLNPKLQQINEQGYSQKLIEQENGNIKKWYVKCRNRFNDYLSEGFSGTFKYISQIFFGLKNKKNILIESLSKELVNLDWCPYYSKEFPTITESDIVNYFNQNLDNWLNLVKPKIIFLHGKSLKFWFDIQKQKEINKIKLEKKFPITISKNCECWCGKFITKNIESHLIYLEYGITSRILNSKRKDIIEWLNNHIKTLLFLN